jgi:hypothetical protein
MYVAVSREECNAEMRNLSTALEGGDGETSYPTIDQVIAFSCMLTCH